MAKLRIKDIAELANVSIGTVDRVIHKRGEVSELTRQKVQQILEEHNFEPDPIASSLAMKKTVNLAVVMPGTVNGHVFWDLPRAGVERAMDELSSQKLNMKCYSFDQFSPEGFRSVVSQIDLESIDGVLFAPVFQKEGQDFVRDCKRADVPVVLINSTLEDVQFASFVGQDAFQSGYVAARLINYGFEHRRDALIINMSARNDHYGHLIGRERGFRHFFEEQSGRLDNLLTLDLNGVNYDVLVSRLDELWSQYRIGGIFVSNSRVYKVAEYLASRGIMSTRLVGYDLLPESVEYLQRDYIDFLISQRPEEQAYLGLRSLFQQVAYKKEPEPLQMMPIDIITRENLKYYKH